MYLLQIVESNRNEIINTINYSCTGIYFTMPTLLLNWNRVGIVLLFAWVVFNVPMLPFTFINKALPLLTYVHYFSLSDNSSKSL